jgi:dipeptidyl aminopeptidase/acylaminoacyl peptidase
VRSFYSALPIGSLLPPCYDRAMTNKKVARYGSWRSPISAGMVARADIRLDAVAVDGEDIYWSEMRPAEAGRYVIVRRSADGETADAIPAPYNVRTRAHEYGGGAYTVIDGVIYFANYADQRLYRQSPGDVPEPVTPEATMRYADLLLDRQRGRLLCVREDHGSEGEAVNTLVAIDLDHSNAGEVLVSGNDFYATPRLSPDGERLAWLTWNHPNMPWDGTELWVAEILDDGSLGRAELIAGGLAESIFQPEWSPEGELYFASDRTGWWNLYRQREGRIESVYAAEVEFGTPQWVFGLSKYAFVSAGEIACAYSSGGTTCLGLLDAEASTLEPLEIPFTHFASIRAGNRRLAFVAASPSEFMAVYALDLESGQRHLLRASTDLEIDRGVTSLPEAIEFPTEGGLTAHAFYYAPHNEEFQAPEGERPPLIVKCHGGPTGSTTSKLNLEIQYWTSRGLAVLDVNYGGSAGFGRTYRERLKDKWGIVDVDDCVNGARYLVSRGDVDGDRLAIRGGSAGGYTTLLALTVRDFFHAGSSLYGLSDLEAMVYDTHKFESRYLDGLIGPYPERADLYRERSPIDHIDKLSSPLILFQGLEDKVVLPNQAEMMFEAARKKGLPVAYVPFEGEQHGFRRAENIKRLYEAELYFYGVVFGFEPADRVEPVHIENV